MQKLASTFFDHIHSDGGRHQLRVEKLSKNGSLTMTTFNHFNSHLATQDQGVAQWIAKEHRRQQTKLNSSPPKT